MSTLRTSRTQLGGLIAAVVLLIAVVALHTYHFSERNYRQDEAWRVHLAAIKTIPETVGWSAATMHPPGWQIFFDIWVGAFGQHENITRFSSTLLTLVTLSLTYRLAADLFDARTGWLAAFTLGTWPLLVFFGHEARPYALLILCVIGMQWAFLRWMRQSQKGYGLLFVAFGIGAAYAHLFGLYFAAGLFIIFPILVRLNRRVFVRGLALFAAIGVAFTPWLLPFLHSIIVFKPGGIDYGLATNGESLTLLHEQMQLRPSTLGQLLALSAVLIPVSKIFPDVEKPEQMRFRNAWVKIYVVGVPLIILILSLIINVWITNVTPRNLIILLPSLAVLVAYGIRALPWQVQMVIILLLTLSSVGNFRRYVANGPYREIASVLSEDYAEDARYVINARFAWQHVPITYSVRERLPQHVPNDALFHIVAKGQEADVLTMPDVPQYLTIDAQPAALERFAGFLSQSERVWYVETDPVSFADPFIRVLDENFLAVATYQWGTPLYPNFRMIDYQRIPADLQTLYSFGETFSLQRWSLGNDVRVQPCQSITLESWWQADQNPDTNYSLGLVLSDANGMGIARSDGSPAKVLTLLWQPNQLHFDRRSLAVPCDATPGEHPLVMGLYHPDTAAALPIAQSDGTRIGDLLYLTTLVVE